MDKNNISYRNIVMCPPHLVEKWADEIRSQVPYAKVTVLHDFKQLVDLKNRGKARNEKEWFVISKDFSKLSYQSEPIPKKRVRKKPSIKYCLDCNTEYITPGHTCPECGSREYGLKYFSSYAMEGMTCPFCNQLLLSYKKQVALSENYQGEAEIETLDYDGFLNQKDSNSRCYYCEEELWQPHVSNLGADKREPVWVRMTHYANKAHKGKKSVWVHSDYVCEYFDRIKEQPLSYIKNSGSRKYSPAEFIKRYMKGFFDIAIFDEAHLYKGGTTGQGHAMHAIMKASKKTLALTGTIAGGYANHLYYLLWRLYPSRMKKMGYSFEQELAFVRKYGKLETVYEYDDSYSSDGVYKASCKGKQKNSPQVKPGISPLIFMDFLLDCTTFLDLSDMSKYLPALKEKVITVEPDEREEKVLASYNDVIKNLKEAARDKIVGGLGVLSNMLQFSLSYMDKPFGRTPILSPKTGDILAQPDDYPEYINTDSFDNLLSKEKKLVELVNQEQREGRNCFVFAEYTASEETNITYRLQEILEKHCNLKGKVVVLESTSPKATQREAWMHKKAEEGAKVFISNPRCVETGLDFCFKENGKDYNYPTIIFYQLGYSLFTIWQASRRAYRLNQKEECRTYYMALEGTVQTNVIELIAEKQAATSAIQGKFSTEGLAAMANGTDARMKLAQSLSQMDMVSGNKLQDMFDVLAVDNGSDDVYEGYVPMKLFGEIVDLSEDVEYDFDFGFLDVSDYEELYIEGIDEVEIVNDIVVQEEPKLPVNRRCRKQISGQISLFSM